MDPWESFVVWNYLSTSIIENMNKREKKYLEAKITEEDCKQCIKSILHAKNKALTDMHSGLHTPTMHKTSLLNSLPLIHHVTCRLFIKRQKARFLSFDTTMVIDTSRH